MKIYRNISLGVLFVIVLLVMLASTSGDNQSQSRFGIQGQAALNILETFEGDNGRFVLAVKSIRPLIYPEGNFFAIIYMDGRLKETLRLVDLDTREIYVLQCLDKDPFRYVLIGMTGNVDYDNRVLDE